MSPSEGKKNELVFEKEAKKLLFFFFAKQKMKSCRIILNHFVLHIKLENNESSSI